MAFQEQPYPCVHLARSRPQLHHRVLRDLRSYLSGRYGILRPALSRQWRPRVQNWDPQPGRQMLTTAPHNSAEPIKGIRRARCGRRACNAQSG
ncbi:hypothetical protein SVAN01_02562 [Stagonosporopsis vannaccii]|nr:hypothetical protein SVAN01_02562 [Stagonosporopsis vannaccii]